MTEATIIHHMNIALSLILLLSMPPLLIASVVGLVVGLLQAVTQIQDQTLPLAVKLIAVILSIVLMGPLLVGPLLEHTEQIFREFPTLTH
ncbi:MAG: type III secretion system export apparatus subunit SctS [Rhizobiales bacterium]|nr:type III secretion system export apparatus subunit SctS [Hyphomicrobiales bacterium]